MKPKTSSTYSHKQPAAVQCTSRCYRVTGLLAGMAAAQVALAASGDAAPLQVEGMTGEEVYNNICIACHSPPGVGGAPALGDAVAWAPRIAQGMDTLVDHALNGFSGDTGVMPKKGERLDMSDEEITRAVEYMVRQADQ